VQGDARLRLWLNLYADALSSDRGEYRVFRYFNLLEGIGEDVVLDNEPVLDDTGHAYRQANGQPYTTKQARGKVFTLVRDLAQRLQTAPGNFVALRYGAATVSLWDESEIWVKVRNAVAHRGTWRLPSGELRSPGEQRIEEELRACSPDGSAEDGLDEVARSLRVAVEFILLTRLLCCCSTHLPSTASPRAGADMRPAPCGHVTPGLDQRSDRARRGHRSCGWASQPVAHGCSAGA
jgi:hypothetical protein